MPSVPPSCPLTTETLLSCAPVPVRGRAGAPHFQECSAIKDTKIAFHSCGKEATPKGWDIFSCCRLLPQCPQKAVPYLSGCWRSKPEKTPAGFTAHARNSV